MRFKDILLPRGVMMPIYTLGIVLLWVSGIVGDHVHAGLIPAGIAIPVAFLKPVNLGN